MTRRAAAAGLLALGVALSAAVWPGSPGGPGGARAATPDLTLVTQATYEVLPAERRVAVTVEIVATNHLVDTAANRYFFEQAYLAVQPGASEFTLTSAGHRPKVSVAAAEPTHTLLLLRFGTRLAAGASRALTLRFDLRDPGTPPERDIRVSETLVTFSAWAFASDATPGSEARIRLPAGYEVEFIAGSMPGPVAEPDGRLVWASGPLDDPLAFEAQIRATRAATYVTSSRSAGVGNGTALFAFRAWRDDPEWLAGVSDLVLRGAPALSEVIGLPWPRAAPLVVEEAVVAGSATSAGRFDPLEGRIELAFYAGPEVALHELAHAWFNGSFLADRWANEAFAGFYAELAAPAIGTPQAGPELTDELRAAAIPLNAWGAPEHTDPTAETYGYAASLELAREIARRAGPDGLKETWTALAAGTGRTGTGAGGLGTGAPDWRGLLDLLEATTPATYSDLWLAYVVRPEEVALIHERGDLLGAIANLRAEAGPWRLPGSIADAMAAWRFDSVRSILAAAAAVVVARDALAVEAQALGLDLPAGLAEPFEAGRLDDAQARIEVARTALRELGVAAAARPADPGPIERLGLLGSEPDADLARGRAAYTGGDLAGAFDAAMAAGDAWRTAGDVGRGRMLGSVLALIAAILAWRLFVQRAWARRGGWS